MYVAVVLDSSTLEKDAACSLGCIKLSLVLLAGAALYKVLDARLRTHGAAPWPCPAVTNPPEQGTGKKLWWADSAAALVIGLMVRNNDVHI